MTKTLEEVVMRLKGGPNYVATKQDRVDIANAVQAIVKIVEDEKKEGKQRLTSLQGMYEGLKASNDLNKKELNNIKQPRIPRYDAISLWSHQGGTHYIGFATEKEVWIGNKNYSRTTLGKEDKK